MAGRNHEKLGWFNSYCYTHINPLGLIRLLTYHSFDDPPLRGTEARCDAPGPDRCPGGNAFGAPESCGENPGEEDEMGRSWDLYMDIMEFHGKNEVEMGFHEISWELRKVSLEMNFTWNRG